MFNPLHWRKEHQIAGLIICVIGGFAGIFFAWLESPLRLLAARGRFDYTDAFLWWLGNMHLYWPWLIFGSVFSGLAFYAVELSRSGSK